ncbi:4-(cytidine 5'-diphospho)-2-C-methyl-D-erythritol kinase [Actibacterium sp. MT2.3-13A]|uniref:4-(cytidine 5'-diphospho)-2-C-methyl-D-erythritol kinase n=1 Tax=Actibacterium sp. MT2.3-13A TaxID=2828332 RepID=UPI001BA72CCF|nr:4-(cytidine 5'-diphospho)-2-C-methyl-D-erythritol kinase [Actibacterium sp. MT2.3-13A]
MAIEARAPAKVNLTLHVTGQRVDGYHLLDSLVLFADLGDRLRVERGPGLRLTVAGPLAAGVPTDDSNSILRAARLLGAEDLHFTLTKVLPTAAGIGGGTSDAAAALRAVAELSGLDLPEDVSPLGADVPVCLLARAARMEGIGEKVTPVGGLPALFAVLANPGAAVSTPAVFRRLASKTNPPMPETLPEFATARDLAAWLATQRNDLQAPAIAEQPVIAEVLKDLSALPGQLLSRMSGSGATCFALFETCAAAEAAAQALHRDRPGWWVVPCALS